MAFSGIRTRIVSHISGQRRLNWRPRAAGLVSLTGSSLGSGNPKTHPITPIPNGLMPGRERGEPEATADAFLKLVDTGPSCDWAGDIVSKDGPDPW